MQVDKDVAIIAMIMDAILGLGYMTYSSALLIAASLISGTASMILFSLSAILFIYAGVRFGGFQTLFSGISDTSVKK